MYLPDLYWMPSTAIVAYEWAWLCGHRETLKPVRVRVIFGLLGLLLATVASLSLLAAVFHSWAIGCCTWATPFDGGILLGLVAIFVGAISKGRLRFLTIASASLNFAAWIGYAWSRRSPL